MEIKKIKCHSCEWKGGAETSFSGKIICPSCFKEIEIKAEDEEKKKTKKSKEVND